MDGLDGELARLTVVLLEDRVLRRVIKKHRRLPGIGLQVPHARCYTLPRADLVSLVERDELHVDPAALPAHVAIVGGSRPALAAGDKRELSRAWRVIFLARIHQAFDALLADTAITPASVRERINRIGQTEFDEIRSVLRQEDLLLPPADDTTTYGEFVALYLELQHFAPRSLDRTFPTLDLARVDAAIALDFDGPALLAAARPAGAPEAPIVDEPAPPVRAPDDRAAGVDSSARTRASRARGKGNRARAAILSLRAGDREMARQDLDELGARLARAVGAEAPLVYFGGAGTLDFNYEEIVDLDAYLDSAGVRHQVEYYPGPHGWPPKSVMDDGLTWMELQAMRRGLTESNEAWIDSLYRARLAAAAAADQPLDAYRLYRAVANDFKGIRDVTGAGQRAARLEAGKQVQRVLARQQEIQQRYKDYFAALRRVVAELQRPATMPELSHLLKELSIRKLQREAANQSDSLGALAAQRLLEQDFTWASFYWPRNMAAGDPAKILVLLDLAEIIHPGRQGVCESRREALRKLGRADSAGAGACSGRTGP